MLSINVTIQNVLNVKSYLLDENGTIIPPKIKNPQGRTITDEATNYQIVFPYVGRCSAWY